MKKKIQLVLTLSLLNYKTTSDPLVVDIDTHLYVYDIYSIHSRLVFTRVEGRWFVLLYYMEDD